ncbi:DUF3237 domain-containing protein [uncultured Sphingomonas sp.]|uniref:DUF3237 domain-containing protein n=1 Tax=uncultured Sphingomonas sp. TaxID=158754 RepID=UPI0026195D3D|nr:DUF3237 domain-containing protein [uncultured Sphingomonas sp.]
MIELIPLCTATMEASPALLVGTGPAGSRSIGALTSVTLEGDRLRGTLAGPAAADYAVRTGSIAVIDVRLTIRTHDDALIYMTYGGRLDLSDMAAGITVIVAPTFETGDERYAWLNKVQAVGKATLTLTGGGAARLSYEFYEAR